MLRFIIKRDIKDGHNGLADSGFETVDIDVPELESILADGGFSEHSYDHRALAGVEILDAKHGRVQSVPLTNEQIAAIWVEQGLDDCDPEGFARRIEAAHGITGAPNGKPT